MTTYTTIADSAVDPNAPVTSELMTALRDNTIAITEGASGAPRIYGAAMFSTSAGSVVLRNCLATGVRTVSSGSTTIVIESVDSSIATALVDCTVQVLVTSSVGGAGSARKIEILKNGIVVQTYGAVTGATVSVSLSAGDAIGVRIVAQGTAQSNGSTTLSALQYQVDARSAVLT